MNKINVERLEKKPEIKEGSMFDCKGSKSMVIADAEKGKYTMVSLETGTICKNWYTNLDDLVASISTKGSAYKFLDVEEINMVYK